MEQDKLFFNLVAQLPIERNIINTLKAEQVSLKDTLEILVIEMMIETHEAKLQMVEQQIGIMESIRNAQKGINTGRT